MVSCLCTGWRCTLCHAVPGVLVLYAWGCRLDSCFKLRVSTYVNLACLVKTCGERVLPGTLLTSHHNMHCMHQSSLPSC